MSIAPVVAAGTPTGRAPLHDAARFLGRFDFTSWNDEGGTDVRYRVELRTDGSLGAAGGYATLREAVADAQRLTAGQQAFAAAVLRSGGRYFAYGVLARYAGTRQLIPADFETVEGVAGVADFQRVSRTDRLSAIVDGDFVHRFRAPLA